MVSIHKPTLPDSARLWVYQADRPFTNELQVIRQLCDPFVQQWSAHGQALQATCWTEFDQFIILAVDENVAGASGCSIDASVAFIRQLEQQTRLSLLDRSKVAVLQSDQINIYPLQEIKKHVEAGTIQPNDCVFDNSVSNFGDWAEKWKIRAVDSWMKRFFAHITI